MKIIFDTDDIKQIIRDHVYTLIKDKPVISVEDKTYPMTHYVVELGDIGQEEKF